MAKTNMQLIRPIHNAVFGTVPLRPESWLIPILLGVVVFIAVEFEKFVMRELDAGKARIRKQRNADKRYFS